MGWVISCLFVPLGCYLTAVPNDWEQYRYYTKITRMSNQNYHCFGLWKFFSLFIFYSIYSSSLQSHYIMSLTNPRACDTDLNPLRVKVLTAVFFDDKVCHFWQCCLIMLLCSLMHSGWCSSEFIWYYLLLHQLNFENTWISFLFPRVVAVWDLNMYYICVHICMWVYIFSSFWWKPLVSCG